MAEEPAAESSRIAEEVARIRSMQEQSVARTMTEQEVTRAISQFNEVIANDERLREKLLAATGGEQNLTAFLLEDDSLVFMKRLITIAKFVQEEANVLRASLAANVLASKSVNRSLYAYPYREELLQVARDGDLRQVQALLPPPVEKPLNRIAELQTLQALLTPHFPELSGAEQSPFWFRLFPWARAQDEMSPSRDWKVNFLLSADLRKKMEEQAIDPRQGIRTIEDDISDLTRRKNALAGVIGIVDARDAEEKLADAAQGIESPTTKSLLNARGILAYIRSTANFSTLEETYRGAVSRMHTGVGRVLSFISWSNISPEAQAADLLGGSIANDLASDDFRTQQQAMLSLFSEHAISMQTLTRDMTDEEQATYETEWSRIAHMIQDAKTQGDLERATTALASLSENTQNAKRQEYGTFTRIIFWIQDIFGFSS